MNRLYRWAPGLVALIAIAVYANSVVNEFAYDDWWIIRENARLHQLRDLREIVLTPYWPRFGESLGLYRPLTVLWFAVQWAIGGGHPAVFHVVNVLMHAAVAALVWRLLRHFASPGAALAGAALFALHPVHTEAVANVVGQAEMWAALAVVGASVVFLGRPADRPLSLARLLVIAALYAVGLFAKEHAIVLPGVLVALELARRPMPLREYVARNGRWIGAGVALLGAVVVTYLVVRVGVLGSITGQDAAPQYPFLREEYRVFSALRAWPEYMRLLFFPADLSADYSPAVVMPVEGSFTPMMMLGALILVALVALAASTPWRPAIGLPAAWFIITVLPVSNLLFPIGVLLAERILYLPSVAFALLVAFAWDAVARRTDSPAPEARRSRTLALALCAVLAVWFGWRTWQRNPDWKTTASVIDSVIRDHPESYRAQWHAAALAYRLGDTEAAVYHWEMSRRMWSRDAGMLSDYASYYMQRRDFAQARPLLRAAYELDPGNMRIVAGLAVAELGTGNADESVRVAEYGLRRFAAHPVFFDLRARAQHARGEPAAAVGSWRGAIRRGADTWVQWEQLAQSLVAIDSSAAALSALDSARTRALAANDSAGVRQVDESRVRIGGAR